MRYVISGGFLLNLNGSHVPPLIPLLNSLKWVLGTVSYTGAWAEASVLPGPGCYCGEKKRVREENEMAASAEWPAMKSLQGLERDFDQEWTEHDLREHPSTIFLIILRPLPGIFLVLCVHFFGCSIFFRWSQFLEAVDKTIFYLFSLLTSSMNSHPKSWDGIPSTACSSGCSFGMSFCNRSSSFTTAVCLAGQQWEVFTLLESITEGLRYFRAN